jgi:hypothetical protein
MSPFNKIKKLQSHQIQLFLTIKHFSDHGNYLSNPEGEASSVTFSKGCPYICFLIYVLKTEKDQLTMGYFNNFDNEFLKK